MAQVYAADQGLQLQNETVEAIFYDDAALLLLVIKGGVVFAYDVAVDIPTQHEQLVWTYPLQDGPPVICARCSLDRQLLALQRSKLLVELVDLPSGNISVTQSDKGRSELLGLFFSEWTDAQVVLLSRAGLEMCTLAARRQGLHSRERLRLPIHWYQYSHETRCCIVATGPPLGPPYLQAWQFLSTGLVTLPPFALASSALGTAPNATLSAPTSPPQAPRAATGSPPAGAGGSDAPSRSATPVPDLPVSVHASGGDDHTSPNPPPRLAARAPTEPAQATPQPPQPAAANATAAAVSSQVPPASKTWSGGLVAWMGGGVSRGGGAMADLLLNAATTASGTPSALPTIWPNVLVGSGSETVTPASAVRLLKVYGRVYCAHVNSVTKRLDLYRMFTDTVVLQNSYQLPHEAMQLSVVDNVIVAHDAASGSALLIDVCADANRPLTALRPLGHLTPLRRPRQLEAERLQQQLQRQARAAAGAAGVLGAAGGAVPPPTAWSCVDEEGQLRPHEEWQFQLPNLVVDLKSQVVYRMLLDLGAIVEHTSAPSPTIAAFLQRRRAPRLHVVSLDSLELAQEALSPSPAPGTPQAATAAAAPPPPAAKDPQSLAAAAAAMAGPALPLSASQLSLKGLSLGPQRVNSGASRGEKGGTPRLATSPERDGAGSGMSAAAALLGQTTHPHPVMLSGLMTPSAIPSKLLLIQLMTQLIQERAGIPVLRKTFDAVVRAYSEVAAAAATGRASAAAATCVLSPTELTQQVLQDPTLDVPRHYLQAAVCELGVVLAAAGISAPAGQQLMALKLLLPDAGSSLASGSSSEGAPELGPLSRAVHSGLQLLCPDIAATDVQDLPGPAAREGAAALRVQHCRNLAGQDDPHTKATSNGAGAVAIAQATGRHGKAKEQAHTPTGRQAASKALGPDITHPKPAESPVAQRASAAEAGVELVRELLKAGRVVKAARLAQELKVAGVAPQEMAAAGGTDFGLQVALCRAFKCADLLAAT